MLPCIRENISSNRLACNISVLSRGAILWDPEWLSEAVGRAKSHTGIIQKGHGKIELYFILIQKYFWNSGIVYS